MFGFLKEPCREDDLFGYVAQGAGGAYNRSQLDGADVSPTLISKVTDAVNEQVVEWQNRPLDSLYLIIYLDCIVLKIRQDNRIIRKSLYLAIREASKNGPSLP